MEDITLKEEPVTKTKKTMRISVRGLRSVGLIFFLLGILFSFIVLLLCTSVFKLGRIITEDAYEYYEGVKSGYGKYYEIEQQFQENALYKYNKQDIDEAICRTIVYGLEDEYADYYTQEEFDSLTKQYFNNYTGIGVAVAAKDDRYVITRVISASPAEEAGLQEGDVIIKVDGKNVTADDDVTEMISGEAGTKVVVNIKRGGKSMAFEIYRAEVEEKSVTYSVQDKSSGIGYIKISLFRKGTTKEFKLAVKDLKSKGCDKFIIDLRQNTGGVETEGINVADELLPACRIISEKNNKGKETIHNSDQSQLIKNYVLLVDEYTASASEIVSAAVQGNGGTLIGSKTFGKGLVQTVATFKDGSAIKYTTAEYYAPDGSKIDGIGLTPNIQSSNPVQDAVTELKK